MAQGGTQGLSGWAREVHRRSEGLPRGGPSGPRALFGAHCDRLFEDASVFRPFFRSAARKSAITRLFGIRGKAPVRQIHIFLMFFDDFQDAGFFERAASGSLFEGLGRSSGLLGASQGALVGTLGAPGGPLGALGGPLGGPWGCLGGSQGASGRPRGVLGALSGVRGGTLKSLKKHWFL